MRISLIIIHISLFTVDSFTINNSRFSTDFLKANLLTIMGRQTKETKATPAKKAKAVKSKVSAVSKSDSAATFVSSTSAGSSGGRIVTIEACKQ